MQKLKYFDSFFKRINRRLFFQLSVLVILGTAILFVGQTSAQTQDGINNESNSQLSIKTINKNSYTIEDDQNSSLQDLPPTSNVILGNVTSRINIIVCTPTVMVKGRGFVCGWNGIF